MRLRHHFEVGKLSLAKARLASVSALWDFRRSANAKPTTEKRRSTVAEVAGTPRYCRAMRARLGKSLTWFAHHLRPSLCAQIRHYQIYQNITHVRRYAIEATPWGSEVTHIYMAGGTTNTHQQWISARACMAPQAKTSVGGPVPRWFFWYLSRPPSGKYWSVINLKKHYFLFLLLGKCFVMTKHFKQVFC